MHRPARTRPGLVGRGLLGPASKRWRPQDSRAHDSTYEDRTGRGGGEGEREGGREREGEGEGGRAYIHVCKHKSS